MHIIKIVFASALAWVRNPFSGKTQPKSAFTDHVAYFCERLAFHHDYLVALEVAQEQQAERAVALQNLAESAELRGDLAGAEQARVQEMGVLTAIAMIARDIVATRSTIADLNKQIAELTGSPAAGDLANALHPV